jgi:Ca-activated chloride channel family protein
LQCKHIPITVLKMNCLLPISIFCAFALPHIATACDTALVLSVDVSNSVDVSEYRLQVDGMANALQDPEIVDAMVAGDVAIAVMQWSGVDRQDLSIPWRQIRTAKDAEHLATEARLMSRAFILSDTAPAEAIYFAVNLFKTSPDCRRRVIDISGDGTPNAGSNTGLARQFAQRNGITINGIAIKSMGVAITSFFRRHVITRDGFVITARTHREYPDAIRRKIIRELSRALG